VIAPAPIPAQHGCCAESSIKKIPKRQKIDSPQVSTPNSAISPEAKRDDTAPSNVDNIWVRAEKKLCDDKKSKILKAYIKILEEELGLELNPIGTVERQRQLCELLDSKTQDADDKRWKIQFGGHEATVETY